LIIIRIHQKINIGPILLKLKRRKEFVFLRGPLFGGTKNLEGKIGGRKTHNSWSFG